MPQGSVDNDNGTRHGSGGRCYARNDNLSAEAWADRMTGEESRKLKSGDRVFWRDDVKNQGTVRGTSWSGVTVDWDDGESTSVSHNDMAQVKRVAS
jgi:hypothetical protein